MHLGDIILLLLVVYLLALSSGEFFGGSSNAAPIVEISPHLVGLIALGFLVVGGGFIITQLIKSGDESAFIVALVGGVFVFFLVMILIAGNIKNINPTVTMSDCLKLARIKENEGDIDGAIRYLELYIDKNDDPKSSGRVKDKIAFLTQKQIQKELGNSSSDLSQ